MTAQEFVDYLNMRQMPELGYELLEGPSGRYWACPIYSYKDGKPKRIGYEPEIKPADVQTRQVTGWRMWNIPE